MDLIRRPARVGAVAAIANGIDYAWRNREAARRGVVALQRVNSVANDMARRAFRAWRQYARSRRAKPAARRPSGGGSGGNGMRGPVAGKYSRPATVYRRRRRYGRRRRGSKRIFKAVNAVLNRRLATQTFLINSAGTELVTAGDQHKRVELMLWTLEDVSKIASCAIGGSDEVASKLLVTSARADVTIHNNSSIGEFVDIYEILCRRDVPYKKYKTVVSLLKDLDMNYVTDSEAADWSYRGLTPFHSHEFTEHFLIKRKKTMNLEPWSPSTFSIKGRRGMLDPTDWDVAMQQIGTWPDAVEYLDTSLFLKRGWSVGVLLVVRGYPTGAPLTAPIGPVRLDWSMSKTYRLKVLPAQHPAIYYNSGVNHPRAPEERMVNQDGTAYNPALMSAQMVSGVPLESTVLEVSPEGAEGTEVSREAAEP